MYLSTTMNAYFLFLLVVASCVTGQNQVRTYNLKGEMQGTLEKIQSLHEDVVIIQKLKPTLMELVKNNRGADRVVNVEGKPVVIHMEAWGKDQHITISKYIHRNLDDLSMLCQMDGSNSDLLEQLETDAEVLLKLVKVRIELVRAEQILANLKEKFGNNEENIKFEESIKLWMETVQKFKESLKGTDNCFKWRKTVIVAGGVAGAVVLTAAVGALIVAIGFTPVGIVAGSIAAGLMSTAAIAGGGGIAAGSMVAVLQAIGASGLGAALSSIVAGAGLLSGSAASFMIAELIDWMYYGC